MEINFAQVNVKDVASSSNSPAIFPTSEILHKKEPSGCDAGWLKHYGGDIYMEHSQTIIPVVIYARYSSGSQREESIEGQLRECRQYASAHGMTVVGEYADNAISGRTDKRPEFQRMIRDSGRHLFRGVICWKTDRFARNRYDSAVYKNKLRKCGVRLYYARESIPEGPEGIVLESVMEGIAEWYSANLSENIRRGYYDSALEHKVFGRPPFGLRKDESGRYAIDPEQAAVVRRIFEEYGAGERPKDICSRLNAEGFRNNRGNRFNKNFVPQMIANEKYKGVYRYRDIVVQNGIPAIIDEKLFDRCQERLKRNRRAPAAGRGPADFLLSGKIFCGRCGEAMVGDSGTGKSGTRYYYYTCNGRKLRHSCHKRSVRKDLIEDYIVQKLADLISDEKFVYELAEAVEKYVKENTDTSAVDALIRRRSELQNSITNIMCALEAGIITNSTKSRLVELESELSDVESGIVKEEMNAPQIDKYDVIYFIEQFRNGKDAGDEWKRTLIEIFVNAIYLYDDKLILILNYCGPNARITLPALDEGVRDLKGQVHS